MKMLIYGWRRECLQDDRLVRVVAKKVKDTGTSNNRESIVLPKWTKQVPL